MHAAPCHRAVPVTLCMRPLSHRATPVTACIRPLSPWAAHVRRTELRVGRLTSTTSLYAMGMRRTQGRRASSLGLWLRPNTLTTAMALALEQRRGVSGSHDTSQATQSQYFSGRLDSGRRGMQTDNLPMCSAMGHVRWACNMYIYSWIFIFNTYLFNHGTPEGARGWGCIKCGQRRSAHASSGDRV